MESSDYLTKNIFDKNNSYDVFKPKLKNTQKKVIFLTWEELTKLKECNISPLKQYLERVRDVFLFQCFTGLRYSDVFNLRRSDVKANHIEISNQKMNDYLKELAELAGIDEPIRETYYKGNERVDEVTPKYALLGTHAGHRTFICYALAMSKFNQL